MQFPANGGSAPFRALGILYASFLTGVGLFLLITIFLHAGGQLPPSFPGLNRQMVIAIAAGIVLAGHVAGRLLFASKVRAIPGRPDLDTKLADYRMALVLRAGLMEGPLLLAIIGFMLTGFYSLAVVAATGLLAMAMLFPTRQRVLRELALTYEEEAELERREKGL